MLSFAEAGLRGVMRLATANGIRTRVTAVKGGIYN